MKTKTKSIGSVTGPFVAAAAARGLQAPLRLIGQDSRGWQVAEQGSDVVILDEFGDLWWAREASAGQARVVRACWPEETRSLTDRITRSLEQLAHP